MGKSTISMAISNSYVKLPEGKNDWKKADGRLEVVSWTVGHRSTRGLGRDDYVVAESGPVRFGVGQWVG